MTLSHCWGPSLPVDCLTTKSNIEQRLQWFHVSLLPPMFRDAIGVTRRLGIHHVWIDAVCILQDCEGNWATESVKMGDIYQNSVLTIAASYAKDSYDGCFNERSISRDLAQTSYDDKTIDITTEDSTGSKSTIVLFSELHHDHPQPLDSSPLHARGWIFQERILSPRTIHFTSSQVVWECRKEYLLEDRIPWPPRYPNENPTISSLLREDMIHRSIMDHWYHSIVSFRYSGRVFTKPRDRLIALAGIASVYQHLTKDRYLAGIWVSSIAVGLGWKIDRIRRSKPTSIEDRRWPTWSWVSHDGPVSFELHASVFIPDSHFQLVRTALQFSPRHVNDLSTVVGGSSQSLAAWLNLNTRFCSEMRERYRMKSIGGVPIRWTVHQSMPYSDQS